MNASDLLRPRSRQGSRIYAVCLVLYALYAVMYADEMVFHTGATASTLWPLAIPAGVIVCQLIYPTLIGWAIVFSGFAFYFTIGVYLMFRNFRWAQWRVDPFGFVLGLLILMILGAMCAGLLHFRPHRSFRDAR